VAQAVALTVFVIAGNTLLRPLVNAINRIPFDERTSEATYSVRLTAGSAAADRLREQLEEKLEQADYPVAEVEVEAVEHADDKVEIVATLVSTAVEPSELDAVVDALGKEAGVDHATWETSTKD
jgi:putative Mg2+ transporter-C (MgtC) family protein